MRRGRFVTMAKRAALIIIVHFIPFHSFFHSSHLQGTSFSYIDIDSIRSHLHERLTA
jgi:hypothetical protein